MAYEPTVKGLMAISIPIALPANTEMRRELLENPSGFKYCDQINLEGTTGDVDLYLRELHGAVTDAIAKVGEWKRNGRR